MLSGDGGEKDRGSKRIRVPGVHIPKGWGTGGACEGEGQKGGGGDGENIGHREEEVWEGLGETNVVIRQVGMDDNELRGRGMGLEGEREDGKVGGKFHKLGVGGRKKYAGIYGERGDTKGEEEGEGREKSVEFRGEIEARKRK